MNTNVLDENGLPFIVSKYTRAGGQGREIVCPCCNDKVRVYHFSWFALVCDKCGEPVKKLNWVVALTDKEKYTGKTEVINNGKHKWTEREVNTKMIQDISSLQNTMIELKKQLEFNILSVSKIQTFQSRENEIIISIQCRLDLIESGYNNEKNLSKKINTLESKLNAQCLKTKNLETIVKGELRKEISKEYEDIIEQKLKDINLKITNMIKKYENRYEDYNSKFIHLVSEINSLREKLDSNIINDNTNFLITELTTKTTTDMSKLYDRIKIEQSYIKTELNKHICEESLKLTKSINFHNDNETEKYNIIHRKLDECN